MAATVTVTESPSLSTRAAYDLRSIHWGAVIAGLVFTYAVYWLLYLLGLALGFSVADASDFDAIGKGFAYGIAFWILITSVIAYFVGGLFTSRLSAAADKDTGMLHGIALWSVATAVMVILGASGAANLAQGGHALLQGAGLAGLATVDQDNGGDATVTALQAELKTRLGQALTDTAATGGSMITPAESRAAINELDAAALARVATQLLTDDKDAALNTLIVNTNLTREQVTAALDGMAVEIDRYAQQAKRQADVVAGYSAAALWMLFIASAIALIASIIGGWMGANTLVRIAALRTVR